MAGLDKDDLDRSRVSTGGQKGSCGGTVVERGEIDRNAGDVLGSRDGNGGSGRDGDFMIDLTPKKSKTK